MKKDEIIQYWIKSSDEDFEVMIDLFNLKIIRMRYFWTSCS